MCDRISVGFSIPNAALLHMSDVSFHVKLFLPHFREHIVLWKAYDYSALNISDAQ